MGAVEGDVLEEIVAAVVVEGDVPEEIVVVAVMEGVVLEETAAAVVMEGAVQEETAAAVVTEGGVLEGIAVVVATEEDVKGATVMWPVMKPLPKSSSWYGSMIGSGLTPVRPFLVEARGLRRDLTQHIHINR